MKIEPYVILLCLSATSEFVTSCFVHLCCLVLVSVDAWLFQVSESLAASIVLAFVRATLSTHNTRRGATTHHWADRQEPNKQLYIVRNLHHKNKWRTRDGQKEEAKVMQRNTCQHRVYPSHVKDAISSSPRKISCLIILATVTLHACRERNMQHIWRKWCQRRGIGRR